MGIASNVRIMDDIESNLMYDTKQILRRMIQDFIKCMHVITSVHTLSSTSQGLKNIQVSFNSW